jgi:hypothetical protein
LEYMSSEPVTGGPVPPSRKRRADPSANGNEKRELRTSKRARKDVNYIIPSLASIDREMSVAPVRPRRARRRSETSLSDASEVKAKAAEIKEDSPLSVDDEAKPGRRPRAKQAN